MHTGAIICFSFTILKLTLKKISVSLSLNVMYAWTVIMIFYYWKELVEVFT